MNSHWQGFQSVLAEDIRAYLQYKRALGRKFKTEEHALRMLDQYLDDRHVLACDEIDEALLAGFLASRPRNRPRSYNHLLGVMRCFFEWLVVQERLDHSPVQVRRRRKPHNNVLFCSIPLRSNVSSGYVRPDVLNCAQGAILLAINAGNRITTEDRVED